MNLNPAPYTLHPTPYTLHPTPYTLHPTPYTLHPTPYTLNPTYTLHPTLDTRHPTPFTLHPTPYTLHPTPYTPTVGDDNWRLLHGWPPAADGADYERGVVAVAAAEAWLSEREICSICCEQVEPGEANTPASFEDISDST
jgi:hypothetical protein